MTKLEYGLAGPPMWIVIEIGFIAAIALSAVAEKFEGVASDDPRLKEPPK